MLKKTCQKGFIKEKVELENQQERTKNLAIKKLKLVAQECSMGLKNDNMS